MVVMCTTGELFLQHNFYYYRAFTAGKLLQMGQAPL